METDSNVSASIGDSRLLPIPTAWVPSSAARAAPVADRVEGRGRAARVSRRCRSPLSGARVPIDCLRCLLQFCALDYGSGSQRSPLASEGLSTERLALEI